MDEPLVVTDVRHRKMSAKAKSSHKYQCYFLYNPEDGKMYSLEELDKKFYCIPDRTGRKMYYIDNEHTGRLEFIAYAELINMCTRSNKPLREVITRKCDNLSENLKQDYLKVKEYLEYLEKNKIVEPVILDFLEWMVLYTQMAFDDFVQMLGGAYVIINGDNGLFYKKFMDYQYQLWGAPVELSLLNRHIGSIRLSKMSSHEKYMDDGYRLGRGSLIKCDLTDVYKTSPEVNPVFDILIGISKDSKYKGHTAFQFEACRMSDLSTWAGHVLTTFTYFSSAVISKIRRQPKANLGAFGYSIWTDTNPLIIPMCYAYDKRNKPISCVRK